jgi:hypothetical protein
LYARVLRLRYLNPGGTLCFFFFEGAMVLAALLALAELVSWWGVLILPISVALMVKMNDVVADAAARSGCRVMSARRQLPVSPPRMAVGRASVQVPTAGRSSRHAAPELPVVPTWSSPNEHPVGQLDSTTRRARQSALRRYE